MRLEKVIYALNSDLRRKILRLLCNEDMTASEVFLELKQDAPKYRQSVNKTLEILKESGLVRKYYNDTKKALYYRIVKKNLSMNLEEMSVE